ITGFVRSPLPFSCFRRVPCASFGTLSSVPASQPPENPKRPAGQIGPPSPRVQFRVNSVQTGEDLVSFEAHAIELVGIEAESLQDGRRDLRRLDPGIDRCLLDARMRDDQRDMHIVLGEAAVLGDLLALVEWMTPTSGVTIMSGIRESCSGSWNR